MNETALLDVPFANANNAVTQAKTKASEFIPLAQEAVALAIDLPAKIRTIWDGLRRTVQRGQIEATRAILGVFLQRLDQCLGIVWEAKLQAEKAALLGGKPLEGTDRLTAALSDLESLQGEALAGWQHSRPVPLAGIDGGLLWMDEHADIYVGRSNVLLDTIVNEFEAGASPQEIISGYDTVQPADVYGAIACYLRYRNEVEPYLRRRDAEAEELRQKIEAAQPSKAELKAQIKERWSRRKANSSPAE